MDDIDTPVIDSRRQRSWIWTVPNLIALLTALASEQRDVLTLILNPSNLSALGTRKLEFVADFGVHKMV